MKSTFTFNGLNYKFDIFVGFIEGSKHERKYSCSRLRIRV